MGLRYAGLNESGWKEVEPQQTNIQKNALVHNPKIKHNRITSRELYSNDQRAVGFIIIQLRLSDTSIRRGEEERGGG